MGGKKYTMQTIKSAEIIIPDKRDFKTKSMNKGSDQYFIIRRSIHAKTQQSKVCMYLIREL